MSSRGGYNFVNRTEALSSLYTCGCGFHKICNLNSLTAPPCTASAFHADCDVLSTLSSVLLTPSPLHSHPLARAQAHRPAS